MITDYFKITALEPVSLTHHNYMEVQLAYRIDGGSEWHSLDDVNGEVYLDSGQTIEYKGNNHKLGGHGDGFSITSDGLVNISGNLYSLLDDTNFSTITDLSNYDLETFGKLFYVIEDDKVLRVVDASGLELPATTLVEWCYQQMFFHNIYLTAAPALPATTLADGCYDEMFRGCTGLTSTPVLPATNVPYHAYSWCFAECTSLTACTCLATQIDNDMEGIAGWLVNVAANGTFYQNPAHTIDWASLMPGGDGHGDKSIPDTWTVVDYVPRPTIEAAYVGSDEVNKIYMGSNVIYEKTGPAPIDYSTVPLTIEALSDGNINIRATGTGMTGLTIYYSYGDDYWESLTTTSAGTSIPVGVGDKVQFKGDNPRYAKHNAFGTYVTCLSGSTCQFKLSGNIMSLVDSVGFETATTLTSAYTFLSLFDTCTGLTDASNLVLPATTLANYCYQQLFWGCTSLTTAPSILPATSAVTNCYAYMFAGCTSLVNPPVLGASIALGSSCAHMFSGCTSLYKAPDLNVPLIIPNDIGTGATYYNTFNSCTNLHYIKTTKVYTGGTITQGGFSTGVNTDGVFLKPSNTTWAIGTDGVPTGWTVLNYDEEYQIQLIQNGGGGTIVIGDMYGYYGDVIGLEGVDITGEVSLQYNMGQIPFWYDGSVVKSVPLGIIPFGDYEFVFNQDRGLYELIIN